jgi:Uncharacterized conserved protein
MQELLNYFRENPVFFLATEEGDQARVRPFGAVAEFENKLYICTNNKKSVFKQMIANPKVEITAMDKKGGWVRLECKAIQDDRNEARQAMLDQNPSLTFYSVDDGIFEVLYLTEATATFSSFNSDSRVVNF